MTGRLQDQKVSRACLLPTCALVALFVCVPNVCAQETRADALTQERAAKADQSDTSKPAKAGGQDGVYPELGGIPGAGILIGPGYRHRLLGDRMLFDASGAVSWNGSRMIQSQLEWPRLLTDRLSVGVQFKYQDFAQISFFGIGDDSLKANQTDYCLNNVDALGFVTAHPNRWLSVGGRVGVLRNGAIGRGTSSLHPPTGDRFEEATAPSLTRQPDFLHTDVFVEADTRDSPGYPSSGGRYSVSFAAYHDRDFGQYSFQRLEADAAHYVPLFHRSSVLALRGRATLSQTGAGEQVPFYVLPTLGGPNSLRGFVNYRFRDHDLLLLDAEYRWAIFRALDGALFYEAGKVAPTVSALLGTAGMKTDYGLGFRFHSTTRTILRVDLARSHEGTRVMLSLTAPLRALTRTTAR